jgi:drug/metabolite transporter, DME family
VATNSADCHGWPPAGRAVTIGRMSRHESASSASSSPPAGPHPAAWGVACCIIAALGYGGVNVCLRVLTVRCDRCLILLAKEALTAACVGLWLAYGASRARVLFPGWRTTIGLVVVGALTQTVATLPLLWAMAVVGLAITITLSLGASLVTSAVLGRVVLGERVSLQSLMAIGLLVVAVGFLTFGAQGPAETLPSAPSYSPLTVLLATVLASLSGVIYGLLNVSVRRSVTRGVSSGFVALIIPMMGVVCLGPACFWKLGAGDVLDASVADILVMLLAGFLNVVAWFAFIKGLQTTSVVNANVLTAGQVAMAAVAGILFFEEAVSPALLAGVVMTMAGMMSIGRTSPH